MTSTYEVAEKEVLPAVRYVLIEELSNRYHQKEVQIAKELGITQAAISKYLNGKVSDKIKEISKKLDRTLIDVYAKKIAEGDKNMVNACICTVCTNLNDFGCKFSRAGSTPTV